MENIDKLVDEKIFADTEFQSSLTNLTDEEKNPLIDAKRKEILGNEFKSLSEKASKADKAEETAKNQKIRAEKAEAELKAKGSQDSKIVDSSLSTKDVIALTKANVPEEDIDDVSEYAKFKGITVSEALKSPVVTATLAQKAESRRVAQATIVRSTRSQTPDVPDGDTIVKDIKGKGEEAVPEPGSKEAEALFWSRRGRKPQ